jgi:flagellar protein FliO/FliZ
MSCLKRLTLILLLVFCAAPLYASDTGMATTGLKTIFSLLLIIALMFGLAWVLKRYGPYAKASKSFGLTVIGQVGLNAKANLALVRVGKSILLLGVTQDSINLLKDLEQGDFEKSLSEITPSQGTSL